MVTGWFKIGNTLSNEYSRSNMFYFRSEKRAIIPMKHNNALLLQS